MINVHELNEQDVLAGARRVFWMGGYVHANEDHFEQLTGVPYRELVDHFGSKRELFNRTLNYYMHTVITPHFGPLIEAQPEDAALESHLELTRSWIISGRSSTPLDDCYFTQAASKMIYDDPVMDDAIERYRRYASAVYSHALATVNPTMSCPDRDRQASQIMELKIAAHTLAHIDRYRALWAIETAVTIVESARTQAPC